MLASLINLNQYLVSLASFEASDILEMKSFFTGPPQLQKHWPQYWSNTLRVDRQKHIRYSFGEF